MSEAPGAVYKRDFWADENVKYDRPHHRMRKVARVVNRLAAGKPSRLLDVGCGPAALARLLRPNIDYHGIDIALPHASPNLTECDILEAPIRSADAPFDLIVAQGLFEYLADRQAEKLEEISGLLAPRGRFIITYVNFDHRKPHYYWPYSNIQPSDRFRHSLTEYFVIDDRIPTAHNWTHSEPTRWYVSRPNLYVNTAIPIVTKKLAVEYLYVCRQRD